MYFNLNNIKTASEQFLLILQTTKPQMQSQNTKQAKSSKNMTTYFQNLTVNFNSNVGIKQPDKTDKSRFYQVYSPEKFKLRPRDDIHLNLKFNVQTPERIQPSLCLLPSLKEMGLHIENDYWASNMTKGNTIELHILNRSFNYTINV